MFAPANQCRAIEPNQSDWWASADWREYERLYGVTLSRVDTLASATWQTRVVDLTVSDTDLWRGLRRSAKALIHKAERTCAITVRPAHDMTAFRLMHLALAGRATRPIESWDLMAEWVTEGKLVLVGAAQNGVDLAFAAAYVVGDWSYYGHAAATTPSVGHALVWRLMTEAKRRGATVFEVGWQGQDSSAKGQGIEQFRRAFGGVDVPAASQGIRSAIMATT